MGLPEGWIRCDGSAIPEPSVWAGSHTPNLNGQRLFLRGGGDTEALVIEDDMFQDHTHLDAEHTHGNSGHSHSYKETKSHNDEDCPNYPSQTGNYWHYMKVEWDHPDTTFWDCEYDESTHSSTINIQSSKSGMEGVDSSSRHGPETRPKNMAVIWIMRTW